MAGGVPIRIGTTVVGGTGLGGTHGDEDVKIARAGLQVIDNFNKALLNEQNGSCINLIGELFWPSRSS